MKDENITSPPELTRAESAVLYLLQRIACDPALRWHMLHTEAFARLCEAEAQRSGRTVEGVEKEYGPPCPPEEVELCRLRKRVEKLAEKVMTHQEDARVHRLIAAVEAFPEILTTDGDDLSTLDYLRRRELLAAISDARQDRMSAAAGVWTCCWARSEP